MYSNLPNDVFPLKYDIQYISATVTNLCNKNMRYNKYCNTVFTLPLIKIIM